MYKEWESLKKKVKFSYDPSTYINVGIDFLPVFSYVQDLREWGEGSAAVTQVYV